jgi:uncharacterized protein (DUF934 family)
MRLVRAGRIAEDEFVRIADDAPIPHGMAVIVTGPRFLADTENIIRRAGPTGVLWSNNAKLAPLLPGLHKLALVALVFPTFKDGRAYSQARLLRERLGFMGELRATGDILRDQFSFLVRAGFDSFEVKKDADAAAFAAAVARYSVVYQPTGDGRRAAAQARRDRTDRAKVVLPGETVG